MLLLAQTGNFVIVLSLVQNVSMLVAMSVLLVLITRRLGPDTFPTRVLSGLLFGAAVMVGMATPLRIVSGVIFDARSVLLAVAGFSGGPLVGIIAGVIAVAYRLALGGAGMWVGVAVAIEATALGVLVYYMRRRNAWFARIPALLGFGLVVHIAMLLTQLALPGGVGPDVLRRIGLPVLALFPAATALVCRMLLDQEEREQEIEATRVSEERYRLLAENTADVIWEVDLDLVGVYANPAVESLIGYTSKEFVGLPFEHYCDSESLGAMKRAGQEAVLNLPDASPQRFEAQYLTREGGRVEVEILASPVLGASGAPVGFQGVTRDISARKAEERAVRERNDVLERLVHERTEGIEAVNAALLAATADL
ncbi:MAG: LytS/YhcK type 5TM receptor domain-containing protein, partial [Actinomycetota bacterium]|nr:LytS/YhcK type 5TM receptor domain-containing protein [Actinomycetota bacterium]